MTALLDGKVVWVTGAATGLGAAIASCLADAGARGLAFDIVENCPDLPGGWISQQGDVTSDQDLQAAISGIRKEFGQLDIVVANAGVVPPWHDTESIDLDEWDDVFAVNVRGVAATIKYAVPLMKSSGGTIVVMGSLNSRRAHARQCLYTATKHAVLGIVRSAALDLGRYGIRVNALGPGPIATDALMHRLQNRAEAGGPSADSVCSQFSEDAALGRMATAADVARAALFLASPQADGITGQILPVDAGLN